MANLRKLCKTELGKWNLVFNFNTHCTINWSRPCISSDTHHSEFPRLFAGPLNNVCRYDNQNSSNQNSEHDTNIQMVNVWIQIDEFLIGAAVIKFQKEHRLLVMLNQLNTFSCFSPLCDKICDVNKGSRTMNYWQYEEFMISVHWLCILSETPGAL